MKIPDTLKVKIVTTLVAIALLLVAAFLIALPFKQTRFFVVKLKNLKQQPDVKMADYEKFVGKYPDFIPARISLAEYYAGFSAMYPDEPSYFEKSEEHYKRALDLQPQNTDALSGIGGLYYQKGDYEKAEALFKKLVELAPEKANFHLKLARNYAAKNETDLAMEEVKKALSLDPEYPDAYLLAGILYEKKGDRPDAINAYRNAIEYFGDSEENTLPESYFRLVYLYLRSNLYFDGIQQLEKLIKLRPTLVVAHLEVANIYLQLGLPEMAISALEDSPLNPTLESSIRINPLQRALSYRILGFAYMIRSDFIAALAYFKKAEALGMRFDPNLINVLEKLAVVQQARTTPGEEELEGFVDVEAGQAGIQKAMEALKVARPEEHRVGQTVETLRELSGDVGQLGSDKVFRDLQDITGGAFKADIGQESTGIITEEIDLEGAERVFEEMKELTEGISVEEPAAEETTREDKPEK